MAEEIVTPTKAATIEEFLSAAKVIKTVMIDEMPIRIKPLTYHQEYKIAEVVSAKIKQGMSEEMADREYMKLAVFAGVVEPKMDEVTIQNGKWGHIKALADAIGKLTKDVTKDVQKKE